MELIELSIWLIIPVLMLLLVKSNHWTKPYYNQSYVYPAFLGYLLLPECLCSNPKDFITGTILWVLAVFLTIFITWVVVIFLRRSQRIPNKRRVNKIYRHFG